MLHVVGDKPAAEKNTFKISMNREISSPKNHTINFKIDETDADNYALLQFIEENPAFQFRLWYEAGKYLYGGNDGVGANIVMDDIIPESNEDLNIFQGVAKWKSVISPERITNPIADFDPVVES